MIPNGKPGKRRYGTWAGEPKGRLENLERCIESVSGFGYINYQCSRRRGWGLNSDFCLQHSKKHPSQPAGPDLDRQPVPIEPEKNTSPLRRSTP